ncbi:TIGR00730 family Rossman fold protein [Rhodovulum sulfidophilum]|uniref:Cytokinin riboside 5'-monophosphate phosphoribohydrolase n=1 Tax=Rhodovulum sulfidophilum TaxID=35806 RepID=A0A0D6B4S0_RHOSU|nr:TIGR00730 family Rossman fold protein [Rhodovulum sulfidophilum]ANB34043.1 Rossman fold protein, TIGR00730 family [Rhodovulum sulfidophilum DSM 1374]ANB37865.1 Rossman fold protein, TIGR00730 family [Rhodovulum sulfidophilum]MBK5924468.1 Rossman fold protein, TIGR00730 family [Rhodovulum sulfidophilum]MBL3561559.1 TIGR00730 family Rossman fold protein [Rhodovulum sulfidophilum]MBL3564416.1 TIGR00730 family Rossman fold protein [Rhodovulum sulfidophilum]
MTLQNPSICVFCGSRDGDRPAYAAQADALGHALAEAGWRLVYGAGDVGLMGRVARAAQGSGGQTFGVIPVHLLDREVGKRDLSAFIVTENMHERKKVMYMNSDAIVVLPGGAGSLDEFFEVLTWRQLGLHAKPIYLLNTEGFWNPLSALIHHFIDEGFAEPSLAGYVRMVSDVPALMEDLRDALSSRRLSAE